MAIYDTFFHNQDKPSPVRNGGTKCQLSGQCGKPKEVVRTDEFDKKIKIDGSFEGGCNQQPAGPFEDDE